MDSSIVLRKRAVIPWSGFLYAASGLIHRSSTISASTSSAMAYPKSFLVGK